MITYSKIGKKGNLGNQLFQIASTIGLASANNFEYGFSEWKYQCYFKNKLPPIDCNTKEMTVLEEQFYNCHNWDFGKGKYDLSGWLQTEKYFDAALTKHYFQFNDDLINSIKRKYSDAFDKKTILISIRRGDFVNHPDYFQTSIKYYINSLEKFFPDWESKNLIVLSDDVNYCKFHFSFLKNAFFGENLNVIEQLCLGTLCDDFIIGNSTFSWWSAWLGEKEESRIIRPFKNFIGNKSLELNDKDYFPERWIQYNHLNDKIKLDDIVFCLKSNKNKDVLESYILFFFEAKVEINSIKIKEGTKIYFFEEDYILPPVLIYYTCRKINSLKDKIIVNNVRAIFGVSKKLNYLEFKEQSDFGLFSDIFSFSNYCMNKKLNTVYLENHAFLGENLEHISSAGETVIDCSVGKFFDVGGYKFSFNRCLKGIRGKIKKKIKNALSIQ